ncbi:DUF885 domain-containing protein [Phenylobacterium sp.]|uniref:DUF885 domain-containing protein n=1 Tax=Phenylobacterium sp. TaxID=1871053 RepID=UPI002CD54F23|nr:DUF885 family protein [Phenylobacterium sp.]HVI34121.1 DUF885 family protein [Phenylobacterium sp.]
MLSRRNLLLSAGATVALAGCATASPGVVTAPPPPTPAAPPPPTPQAQLSAYMDQVFREALDDSPQFVTSLGLDKDDRAAAKARLDDASLADLARDKALTADQLRRLKAIPREPLTGMAAVNYDTLLATLEVTDEGNRKFQYGYQGAGQPYVLSQLTGAYQSVPDFLGTQHTIETKADADAYLSRLDAFATQMDQELERARHDVGLGVIPPDFVVERSLTQMAGLVGPADRSPLVTSVATRAKEKGIAGDYAGQASLIYRDKVVPALQRQIAFMKEIQPRAVHDAGAWRLPDGEAYYDVALRGSTTTTLSPDEIHQIGLDQARELSARADVLLKKAGYSRGTVGQRIQALYRDKKYHYPNTDAGKEKLLADLNAQVKVMSARLPQMFATLPKAPVEVRRVPKFIEAGAPGGYYNQPTLDGSRPGIYWINLRDTAENPTWTLPTLTYHEAVPGHHMQLALQQEADLPMIRRAMFFSSYGEGWALYAEQLAQEMGVYADDPLAEVGYLQSSLFRSARLVVDTGLHFKRWSREKAIDTMTSIDGSPRSAATTEIERYCVWPGQACSYMVGKLTWVRLRDKAKAALGPRFDLRQFHDAGLLAGAMPLTVLEARIDQYIASARA